MEQINRIAVGISYLNRPIIKKGIMQEKLNGTVEMDGEIIPDGTRFEYMIDGAWHYEILRQDKKTKKYQILNWNGSVEADRIEQLSARIRGGADQ